MNTSSCLIFLKKINHTETSIRVKTEREVLKVLDGDCDTAVGAISEIKNNELSLWGELFSIDGNRRYYDEKTINLLKKVKFLLKDKGMTIKGVKKILNNEDSLKLDEIADKSIRTENLRNKLLKISKTLRELKNGKKNTR